MRIIFFVFSALLCPIFLVGCHLVSERPGRTPVPNEEIGPKVNQVAVDIQGTDRNGIPMTLKDHRGKVVTLVFWADTSPASRALYDQFRSLVKQYRGRPFVLLGVNSDPDRKTFLQAKEDGQLPWYSWYDGTHHKVANAFRVEEIPTVILLDASGVIRCRQLFDEELEQAVEELVREAEGL